MSFFIVLSASVAVLLSVYLFPLLSTNYLWNLRGPSSSSLVADLFVTNGSIYTSDSSLPFADSMAIRGGRVLGIGNYSSVKDLVGYGTEVMNLEGKAVVPGFIDSHVHLLYGGLQMVQVELRGVNKKDEFIRKVKDAVRNLKHGSWLLGGGWNNDLWGEELPMASWIDDVTPHNPVWLSRMDGHMGLANSVALKIAGITNYTEDPDGGAVIRNTYGEPTGLLIDSAMKLVFSSIPEVSIDGRREALVRASNYALTKGVTTVSDFGRYVPGTSAEIPWEDFSEVYRWADISGKMKIRICLFFPMNTWSRLQALIHEKGRKLSQWLYLGGVKAFSDGSLGSNSALFYEPYVDDPQNCGLQVTDMESLFNMTLASDKSGLQVAIHAIGDRANDFILDMYKSVVATNGIRDRRFRGPFVCSELGIGLDYNTREPHSLHLVETLAVWIAYPSNMKSHKTMGHIMSQEKIEHAQHLAPGAVGRFGEEGIVASVQPDHLLYDADSAIRKLGVERAQRGSYLFRSLLASNLSFGSDWPVVDINPLSGIQTAMKRIPPGWENPWIPLERINLIDALNAYTISAARAIFLEEEVGSLSPGKFADFVVLSTESWDEFMAEGSASVKATYVGGVQLYP